MSHAAAAKGWRQRLLQALSLALVFVGLMVMSRVAPPSEGPLGVITALGFLLLAGVLAGEVADAVGLPHLTAYILVGIVAGPHVLHIVDHQAVDDLQPVGTLALALIALAGGAELRMPMLLPLMRSLSIATAVHTVLGFVAMAGAFFLVSGSLSFCADMPASARLGISMLWGALAVSRSPSALLGVLAQLRADGPLTRYALGFVMSSDVVVTVLLTLTIAVARPFIEPGAVLRMEDLQALGHELLGSVAIGCTVGIVLAIYLRLVQGRLLIVLVALGFGLTEAVHYLRFHSLLTFIVAGFMVANASNQGPKLLHAIEDTAGVVYVVFFATAGAHLDLPLLGKLWPYALGLSGARALVTYGCARLSSRLAADEPVVRRWGFAPLVSQAGLTLGLSAVIASTFPSFGGGFRALAVATVAINELVGPVLWKLGLDRTNETGKGAGH
jgi:Kef-type K+ transport system membrane component KefB